MEDACSSVQLTAEHFHQKLASSVQQGGWEWAGLSGGGGVNLRSDGSLNEELSTKGELNKYQGCVLHLLVTSDALISAPKLSIRL